MRMMMLWIKTIWMWRMWSLMFHVGLVNRAWSIDYIGGWTPGHTECVDICVSAATQPTCLDVHRYPNCTTKNQRPRDYDFLILEQMYLPQFCRELEQGVDITIAHQNVEKYPHGIQCQADTPRVKQVDNLASVKRRLQRNLWDMMKWQINDDDDDEDAWNVMSIHGLWPNYYGGFPVCCNVSSILLNQPYNPRVFAENYPDVLERLKMHWRDPTQKSEYESLCQLHNHEFQKHGLCYDAVIKEYENERFVDYEASAKNYFEATLSIADTLQRPTRILNYWAKGHGEVAPMLASIQEIYDHPVQVYCSKEENQENQLVSIRTCWQRVEAPLNPSFVRDVRRHQQMACEEALPMGNLVPCNPTKPISLLRYTPPK